MAWYNAPVSVPYAAAGYDVAMGGPHDMDLAETPNTPITALRSGTIVDLSAPPWGEQVGIQLDQPVGNAPYMAFLHLSAVSPALQMGEHINAGDLIGWSGGANQISQYAGTSNPTGQNFLNPSYQSSQPQVGLALMQGPVYGSGPGWFTDSPSAHPGLNPSQLLTGSIAQPQTSSSPGGFNGLPGFGPLPAIPLSVFYRLGFILAGGLLIGLGLKHFLDMRK